MFEADIPQAQRLLERIASVGPDAAMMVLDRLAAWCHAMQLRCIQALHEAGDDGPADEGTLRSQRDTDALRRDSEVARRAPSFAAALADGRIGAGHVHELGYSLRRLDAAQQRTLLRDEARLLALATASTAREFGKLLRREERRLGRAAGMPALEHQQRSVRLRARTDRDSGMRLYTLSLDPLSAASFEQRLHDAVEAMFHGSAPPGCPDDPLERQQFLRAHALLHLTDGRGSAGGRPEIVVVVDTRTDHGEPDIDWGLPVEIPARVLEDLWHRADVMPVVVRNGVVLHAPGELSLGRTTRLANRAQRRALRALHRTCAIPGCDTPFQHCKIHHVVWWRHGGRTDLCNLLPLCHRHHHLVHHGGWELVLGPDRWLTVNRPRGRPAAEGPPAEVAA